MVEKDTEKVARPPSRFTGKLAHVAGIFDDAGHVNVPGIRRGMVTGAWAIGALLTVLGVWTRLDAIESRMDRLEHYQHVTIKTVEDQETRP
jgi:hypothetical protein